MQACVEAWESTDASYTRRLHLALRPVQEADLTARTSVRSIGYGSELIVGGVGRT